MIRHSIAISSKKMMRGNNERDSGLPGIVILVPKRTLEGVVHAADLL